MAATMHTPGPWRVGGTTEYINRLEIEPAIGCAYGAGAEIVANARLIAASPDLLLALSAMLDAFDGPGGTDSPTCAAGRAAIAKALGVPA